MHPKCTFLLLIPLALSCAGLNAQTPVTAYDVYQACSHPAAFPKDSFETRDNKSPTWDGVRVTSGGDPLLYNLCTGVALRKPGMNWRQASLHWARQAVAHEFPSAQQVRAYADDAEKALFKWVRQSPDVTAGTGARSLGLPMIPFKTGESEIAAEDSAAVRRTAELLRDYLLRYPQDVITILGQADPTGNQRDNITLARLRATNTLQAILRYDDGTLRQNIGRLQTAAQIVDDKVISDRVEAALRRGVVGAVARGEDEINTRVGELLKARAPDFIVQSPGGTASAHMAGGDVGSQSGTPAPQLTGNRTSTGTPSIAIAMVDVVGEVAAQQVQIFLVEEVTRGICGTESATREFRQLLPGTCALFGSVQSNRLFRPTLGSLRTAVREDATAMMPRLISTAVTKQLGSVDVAQRADAVYTIALSQYLTAVASGEDALQAAARIPDRLPTLLTADVLANAKTTDLYKVLRQTAPFISLYRDARARIRGGENAETLRNVVYALSLRAALVNAGDSDVWKDYFEPDRRTDLARMLNTIPAILDAATRLETAFSKYQEARGLSSEDRLTLASGIISGSADLLLAVLPDTLNTIRLERLRSLAEPVRDMTVAISRRDFRSALVTALVVARNIVPPETPEQGADCKLPNGLFCPGRVELGSRQVRVMTFAADFANATDQNGMNEALRHFVSEGDGYRSKREGEARRFFTINAYLGLAGAREFGYEDGTETYYQGAFYLPVGIEWVFRRNPGRFPSSFGIFLQVVDLGSIAAARYKDNRDVDQPDPALLDVLSPGIFGVASLGRTPFSVGIGASVAPRAQVVHEGADDRISGALRVSVFAAVDVPLFP